MAEPKTSFAEGNDVRMHVKQIATHPRPHFDEIFSLWLERKFGQAHYPGIHCAPVVTWDCGSRTPDGRPVADHEAEGTLVLGVALSRLDEHARRAHRPAEPTSSAQLVAEDLGIADDPALEVMLQYTSRQDSQGDPSPLNLPRLVKLMQRRGDDPQAVLHWTYRALNACYEEEQAFHTTAFQEWATKAKVFRLQLPASTLRIGEIHSDDERVARVGRHHGCCHVIVQHGARRDGCGNSQIFVTQKLRLPPELATYVRHAASSNPEADKDLAAIRAILLRREPRGLPAIVGSLQWPEEMRQAADILHSAEHRPDVYWATRAIARTFRHEEFHRHGNRSVNLNDPKLVAKGTLPDRDEWHLEAKAGWLLNGAITAPQTPVSRIPQELWLGLIRQALLPGVHRESIWLKPTAAVVNAPKSVKRTAPAPDAAVATP